MEEDGKNNKLKSRTAETWQEGWGCHRGPRSLWLNPGGTAEEGLILQFQEGGGSEGWVVDAPGHPRVLLRHEAVGRGWLHGGQNRLQNDLAVGGWGLKGGRPDPLWGGNGGRIRGLLTIHWGVLLLVSTVATEPLSHAADAQKGYDDEEGDDKNPQRTGKELIFLTAAVTAAFESFGAGEEEPTFGCSLLGARQQAKQQGG